MRKCILGCPKGNTLHKFPADEQKRKEWLRIINMEDCPLSNLYLCTRHFARRMKGKTRVVWNAVPTLNLLGVDECDNECEEFEHDVKVDDTKSRQSPIRKTKKIVVLPPNKAKVSQSKGRVQTDPLYEPTTLVAEEHLVKYQVNFVSGKALKLSPKASATIKNESIKNEEKPNADSKPRYTTRQVAQNTTAENVIKHQIKIVNGKAYKINVPVTATATKANEKNQNTENNPKIQASSKAAAANTSLKPKSSIISNVKPALLHTKSTSLAPKSVRCASEDFLFRKTENKSTSAPLEYEVVNNIESVEKQLHDLFDDGNNEYVEMSVENDYTDSLKEYVQNDEHILTEFKGDKDSEEFLDIPNEEEQSPTPKCIDKAQLVEFGTKIRPKPKLKCGFIECFTNNNTFCLTCVYCGNEFELWDWQQFIEHTNEEHIPKRPPYVRNKQKVEDSVEGESENITPTNEITTIKEQAQDANFGFLTPKVEENNEEDIEMALEENIEQVLKENVEEFVQEDDSMETYNDAIEENIEEDIEVCDEEEDWQVDKLEEYENVEIYEYPGSNIDDNADDINVHGEGEFGEDEEDYEEEEEDNNNEDNVSKAVINLKTTDQTRVLEFLKLLRMQPVLWHPRRYGPPVYDEEMKIFIEKFDDTMSTVDFRRSVEHLRHQYKRFTPLTPRGRAKLQQDDYLRECIQIIKEVADKLSKPFAFNCDVCSFCFLDENRMLTHKYLKHKIGDLKYICSCGIRFAYERQKEEHENLHKLKPRFTCKLCGTHFIFNRLLRDHMNEYHPETQENPTPYACSKCDAKFPSILKRAHHMERHKIPKYHCEICNQSYRTSFRFRHHLKRHQDQRDWVCEHCGKAFVERRSLNAHLFRVHRDGGLKCVYCRTYFAGQESLDAHNRKFHPDGTNLDRMKNIRRHFNTKYKSKNGEEPQDKRVFKCKQCGEFFKNMWALVGHKRQTGHDLKVYNCPHCETVLSSGKTLLGHMRRIHKLPIATMADLRNLLLQNTVEEEPLTAGEEEVEEDVDEGLKLEEIEIFEAYEIE